MKRLLLLPGFAAFIIENHKEEFLAFSRKMLRDLDIPLLRRMSKEEGDALADKSNTELLVSISSQNLSLHIEQAIDRWRVGQFPRSQRNHFVVEDVTGIGHTRKITFLEFLPRYTKDVDKVIKICAEIDTYILEYTATTLHSFVGIIDDRLHEHVEHLERRTKELQESNAGLEEFAYAASHDLKEPLRKISIFIQLLGESMTWPGEKEQLWYDRIVASAVRMRSLIDDLLSLSLLSKETLPVKYSLQQLFDEAVQVFENTIEQTGAVVTTDGLPEATVIPTQFGLLFQNLLSNSLKFAKTDVAPRISVTHGLISGRHPSLEITFSDNGIGFDNEYADKIFAVFQRLHNNEDYEGTGIGLAICRKVVKNHQGSIIAKAEHEKGAVFTITIPIQ